VDASCQESAHGERRALATRPGAEGLPSGGYSKFNINLAKRPPLCGRRLRDLGPLSCLQHASTSLELVEAALLNASDWSQSSLHPKLQPWQTSAVQLLKSKYFYCTSFRPCITHTTVLSERGRLALIKGLPALFVIDGIMSSMCSR
jgi:hypothetical protein